MKPIKLTPYNSIILQVKSILDKILEEISIEYEREVKDILEIKNSYIQTLRTLDFLIEKKLLKITGVKALWNPFSLWIMNDMKMKSLPVACKRLNDSENFVDFAKGGFVLKNDVEKILIPFGNPNFPLKCLVEQEAILEIYDISGKKIEGDVYEMYLDKMYDKIDYYVSLRKKEKF